MLADQPLLLSFLRTLRSSIQSKELVIYQLVPAHPLLTSPSLRVPEKNRYVRNIVCGEKLTQRNSLAPLQHPHSFTSPHSLTLTDLNIKTRYSKYIFASILNHSLVPLKLTLYFTCHDLGSFLLALIGLNFHFLRIPSKSMWALL